MTQLKQINFQVELKDLNGQPIPSESGKNILISELVVNALLQAFTGFSPEQKNKLFLLAKGINSASIVAIDHDEAELIKKVVGSAYGPLIVGQVYELLK